MSLGLIGRKCGMTRIFLEDGAVVPVSVIEVVNNKITQIKDMATDSYYALQVAYGVKRASLISKSKSAHLAKAQCAPCVGLHEFRLQDAAPDTYKLGDELTVDLFSAGQFVDCTGISKGKGFAGGVKRHNFKTQDATHGNSVSHRAPGSTGQCQTPGRVFKGKKMAGHMGVDKVTVQNLVVHSVDVDRRLILVKGSVPGFVNGYVVLRAAIKKKQEAS